jgi:1,4-dihydroxy-2-naphthoate octaprenyltransferase
MTATVAAPIAQSLREQLGAYARLGKLAFFDYYLSAVIVWTLLPSAARYEPRIGGVLVLMSLGWVGVVVATVAFDDVTGYRDGSDALNYDPAQGAKRSRSRKPLLDGRIMLGQAIRFGWAAVAFGAVWLAVAVAVAPHHPAWDICLVLWVLVTSVQYSYGLKLSYRGGQELLMMISTGLTVLIPYGLITGQVTGAVLVESALFGFFSLLVPVYSNMNDIVGDRAAGRRNLATMLPPGTYRAVLAALTCAEFGLVIAAAVAGFLPAWYPAALLPLATLRVLQVRAGLLRGDPLTARKTGMQAHRLGVVLLAAANLITII